MGKPSSTELSCGPIEKYEEEMDQFDSEFDATTQQMDPRFQTMDLDRNKGSPKRRSLRNSAPNSVGSEGTEGGDSEPWLLSREDLLVAGVQEVMKGNTID